MSDLRYYVTAKNKGEKPYVMFLNWSEWSYTSRNARILDLHIAKDNAAHEPTHCLFVEATDGLQHILSKYFEEERQLSYKVFKTLIKEQNCKTVSTRKEKKQPETQAKETSEPQENKRCYALYSKSADGSIKYFCDEKDAIVVALHKGQRVQIFTQSEAHELQHLPYTDEANADVWNVENIGLWNLGEPQETPEEKREYVLYYSRSYEAGYRYYSSDGSETFDKLLAQVMTFAEANQKINELSVKGQYQWLHKKVKIKPAVEEETPSPEAKKRVGYALFHESDDDKKTYFCTNSGGDTVLHRYNQYIQLYPTQEYAEWVAKFRYLNSAVTWQVEQIEF